MKSIRILLKTLKDLISEAGRDQSAYNNMRVIPLPVKSRGRSLPAKNNQS